MKPFGLVLIATCGFTQPPSEVVQPQATMKQLMLDLIHPASNHILFFVNRGMPSDDTEWAAARRSALTLAESGNLLSMPVRTRDQGEWIKRAKALSDVGMSAYKAAQAKDFTALAALTEALDASCTTCHKEYRPNVFPRGEATTGGAK
jgi:hypothetical protein